MLAVRIRALACVMGKNCETLPPRSGGFSLFSQAAEAGTSTSVGPCGPGGSSIIDLCSWT
jgi:hypothetical protein